MIGFEKTEAHFTSFDGTEIYYEIIGQGKPLILCYGIVCLMNHWHLQVRDFAKSHQVILWDYRGHHKSAIPKKLENMTVEAIAKDALALCDHLNLSKASFWGHSFGVQALVELVRIAPDRVSNLVLINGFHKNPIKGMFGLDLVPVFHKMRDMHRELPETFKFLWSSILDNPLAAPLMALSGGFNLQLTQHKDVQIYLRGVKAVELDVFLTLFQSMMEYDGTSYLSDIRTPTLIIAGTKDNVTPLHFQQEINEKILTSDMQVIPYGSHCSQLDMPDFVNLKISKFLNECGYI